eukprot:PhM_4_TR12016/c0_g1_i1/m.105255
MSDGRSRWERPDKVLLAEHRDPSQASGNNSVGTTAPVRRASTHARGSNNNGAEDRERGFSTYFSGANEHRAKERGLQQKQQNQVRRNLGGIKGSPAPKRLNRQQLSILRQSLEDPASFAAARASAVHKPKKDVSTSPPTPFAGESATASDDADVDQIVGRIGRLSDERKAKLLSVLAEIEMEDSEGGGTLSEFDWGEVEIKAGVAMNRYDDNDDDRDDECRDDDGDDEGSANSTSVSSLPPMWLGSEAQTPVQSKTEKELLGIQDTASANRPPRPTSGRRGGPNPSSSSSRPSSPQSITPIVLPRSSSLQPGVVSQPRPGSARSAASDALLQQFQQDRLSSNYSLAQESERRTEHRNHTASPSPGPAASPEIRPRSASVPSVVPLLPRGRVLTVNALITWGDPHYVGLTGLDLFDSTGRLITLSDATAQVVGDPHSINVLPEYHNDPRTADKVMDGINYTRDDVHMWLAPYTEGCSHIITITFDVPVTIAMVRVWNYNKSRVHSFRGARHMEMQLDGNIIFRGEVKQAPGMLEGCEASTEIILFTTEPSIIRTMEAHYEAIFKHAAADERDAVDQTPVEIPRPRTSGGRNSGRPTTAANNIPSSQSNQHGTPARPTNSSTTTLSGQKKFFKTGAHLLSSTQVGSPREEAVKVHEGSTAKIELLGTWGDAQCIGLTRMEILDLNEQPYPIDETMVTCNAAAASDVGQVFGLGHPHFVLPLRPITDPITIYITFPQVVKVGGVRIWNYNRSLEDTFTGVKRFRLFVGSVCVSPAQGTYVRKAPGHTGIDFAHTIMMRDLQSVPSTPNAKIRESHSGGLCVNVAASVNTQSVLLLRKAKLEGTSAAVPRALSETLGYEPVLLPVAYVFKFVISSTHGDVHYVGLNGLEMYDMDEKLIPLTPKNVQAVPRDVTALPSCSDDVRVLDNLVNGENSVSDDENIWLAPYTPGKGNLLYVIFEQPMAISLIKIWNYGKTPTRGVKELTIFADDSLIFNGSLAIAAGATQVQYQSLLFTAHAETVARELPHVPRPHGVDANNNNNAPSSCSNNSFGRGGAGMGSALPTAPSPTPFGEIEPTSGCSSPHFTTSSGNLQLD